MPATGPIPVETLMSVITDKGSRYAVSGGVARSKVEAKAFLATLKRGKKFARATHNSWAVLLADGSIVKNDDGEAGAGLIIARVLEGADRRELVVVVTRWFGGVKLGGDRFRHVATAANMFLEHWGKIGRPPSF